MSLRIQRVQHDSGSVTLFVSGRIRAQDVETLKESIERESGEVAVDLNEVNLVDRDGVKFLSFSEIEGVRLKSCPAYIREWISKERAQSGVQTSGLEFQRAKDDVEGV